MRPGDVVADRFVIEHLAGAGGMGAVYRALDRETGSPVALKVLLAPGAEGERFMQEARMLSELVHPSIVRYVAHGVSALPGASSTAAFGTERTRIGSASSSVAYLAMEWLDGEDLRSRLDRGPLGVDEAVTVARRAAAGLAVAHARGVVHRDVKPSNLFLVDRDVSRVKLLDFGVARHELRSRALTRSGAVIGTVGYMAPEQVTGERDLDSRADVFTLGCVLFECLTGRPAFAGDHVVAVLAKVLMEETPRVREARRDVPPALDDLLARMLAKDRRERPADAAAVAREIDKLGEIAGGPPRGSRPPERLTGAELRFVTVILADVERAVSQLAATLAPGDLVDVARVRDVVMPFSGNIVQLSSATVLVTIGGAGSAKEQAARAATCALALATARPDARIAVATGRAETADRLPVGPAIDRAAAILRDKTADRGPGITIDEVTSGLLDARFDVRVEGARRVLVGTIADPGGRTLLGRPTPCVGREKELALLQATLAECASEPVSRAVLVTAVAGTGKSRLRHEFVTKVREAQPVAIFTAYGDPMTAGSSLGIVRQLVRDACGLSVGDAPAAQRSKLERRLSRLALASGEPTGEFIAELVDVGPSETPTIELRTARSDPRVMSEWLRRSFERWLAAECESHPVLLVIEDLHWGDLPSVNYIASALRALSEKPLMVLALARPEVHDLFPRLWDDANLQEIRLAGLTKKAAERLAKTVLGDDADDGAIARIVARADGNAYYLEELIRGVAEAGREGARAAADDLPDTVLAMAQARIERIEPEARRILRAASVYGEVFWEAGVVALLGGATSARDVSSWLLALLERELLAPAAVDKFPGEHAYEFRHGLSRDAAYATLTDSDMRRGHRLAAEWLVSKGENDPRVLADHFERGGEPSRALPWMIKAAQAALDAGNPEAALDLVERGLAAGATGETLGLLRSLQATAFTHTGAMLRIREVQEEALELLPAGSEPWLTTAAWVVFAAIVLGEPGGAVAVLGELIELEAPVASSAYAKVVYFLSLALYNAGQHGVALALAERLDATAEKAEEPVASFSGYVLLTRFLVAAYSRGDLGAAMRRVREAIDLFYSAGDRFATSFALNQAAWIHIDAGRFQDARRLTEDAWIIAQKIGVPHAEGWSLLWRSKADVFGGHAAEAASRLPALRSSPNATLAFSAQAFAAEAHLAAGRLDAAESEARDLAERSVLVNTSSLAYSVLARVHLAQGRHAEALATAKKGLALFADRLEVRLEGSILHLARYDALAALGETVRAKAAIDEAAARVRRIAATLAADHESRTAYLEIEANARTLSIAGR